MTRELSAIELEEMILRLCDDEALELIRGEDRKLYIPFIMNDAIEAYCTLTDAAVPGILPEDLSTASDVQIINDGDRSGIIVKDGNTILTTVWYESCFYEEHLYQYHRIMHCWEKGSEHMRMLVYMIGTMRDKYEYIGLSACNDIEASLLPLMEYRPFRFFSPIHESIDAWYPDTRDGYETMKALAANADDKELLNLMKAGRYAGKLLNRKISERMASSAQLFQLIYGKICDASSVYEKRRYSPELEEIISARRREVNEALRRKGSKASTPAIKNRVSG